MANIKTYNLETEIINSFSLSTSIPISYDLIFDDFGIVLKKRLSYYDPFYLYEMDASTLNELDYYELEDY